MTKRTYSDSTPEVDYYYDSQALPTTKPPNFTPSYSNGRLIVVCYGGATSSAGSYQSYDQLGRVTSSYQQTDSINYGFGYGYNLTSEMISETYPSGRQVITEYDSAGREAGVSAGGRYYAGATATDTANRIQYAPHGAVSVMPLGNGKWEHTNFNSRLQPTQIGLGTSGTDSSIFKLDYGYGTTSNNGNVISQTITAPSLTVNQCYGYDYLNRLTSAGEKSGGTACSGAQQWKQAFTYDRFGNRNFDLGNTTPNVLGPNPTISQSTNRIASGQNYGYDFAGNLTSDPTTNANGIAYDAENRQTQYTKSGQATNSYYYDGDGHRVKKIDSTGTTVFVYDVGGRLIAEYTAGNPSSGGTSYLTSDHLGSTRVVMKSDGTTTRHDYLPFGEEIQAGIGGRTAGQGYAADNVRQKFTQKERDAESGLDYFGARYYSSAQGRFTSVDPFDPVLGRQGAEDREKAEKEFRRYLNQPQHWNRYPYALNNPLRFVDPDGFGETLSVGLNIVFDRDSHYTDEEKEEIKRRYIEEAKKTFAGIDVTFVVVAEAEGSATNLGNKGRAMSGATGNNLNVFFTKTEFIGNLDEVTNAKSASIFIRTDPKNDTGDSRDLAHGAIHAFAVSTPAGASTIELVYNELRASFARFDLRNLPAPRYEDDPAKRVTEWKHGPGSVHGTKLPRGPNIYESLREGARKLAVGQQ